MSLLKYINRIKEAYRVHALLQSIQISCVVTETFEIQVIYKAYLADISVIETITFAMISISLPWNLISVTKSIDISIKIIFFVYIFILYIFISNDINKKIKIIFLY